MAELFADDAALVKDAEAKQDELLKRAVLLGRVLFAPRPKDIGRWVRACWV